MRHKFSYPILAVLFFLFFWMNLPKNLVNRLRNFAVQPFMTNAQNIDEMALLRIENQNLRNKLDQACEWLQFEKRLAEQLGVLKELPEKRAAHLKSILTDLIYSMPAQVIYRDPSSWSSVLWVNVGEFNNRALGKIVVAKNSPVLAEGALVGVVEYVGEKQSRIRLITDSVLCPSVRALRGATQTRELAKALQTLSTYIEEGQFVDLKSRIGKVSEDQYLAKGEVHGSSAPLWRSRGQILRGVGFNYDFPDEEGSSKTMILKEGDLLVTTGLDGVFPPGLLVGTVAKLNPLKRGSFYYDIEVRPAVHNLNDLRSVFILPPQE